MDPIDREAAINIVKNGYGNMTWVDRAMLIEELKDLPSAQPEQKWIPCSERLPEAKQRVLVTFPDGTVDIKICIDAGHLKWFFAHMIAWMPLPEPYKEASK